MTDETELDKDRALETTTSEILAPEEPILFDESGGVEEPIQLKDPPHLDERTRTWVTLSLVGILAAVIVLCGIGVVVSSDSQPVLDFLNIVLGPLVALVGSATGYYFGVERSRR